MLKMKFIIFCLTVFQFEVLTGSFPLNCNKKSCFLETVFFFRFSNVTFLHFKKYKGNKAVISKVAKQTTFLIAYQELYVRKLPNIKKKNCFHLLGLLAKLLLSERWTNFIMILTVDGTTLLAVLKKMVACTIEVVQQLAIQILSCIIQRDNQQAYSCHILQTDLLGT